MPELHRVALFSAITLLLFLGACGRKETRPPADASTTSVPKQIDVRAESVPVPTEEPSEADLRRLAFQRYAEIARAGGLPVTATASGKSLTLHPKLYEVRKDSCKPSPQSPPGEYECSLTIKLSLQADGSDPSEQGERIAVKWDAKGMWVLQ